ncbi:uveal autoantigen with coiled-coil domains and ankyrin repeats protein-like [Fundulus heteroclitus]|uniref:uveal autoantigen with coiled-coil domains and ankyrin repeats protein-like n=1 Tax=Fundulus heteroclitus TaxID=8078 RepID=UPI00165BFDE3|nr:uveal autoantigen with coiled-coil domains and ankyrin repeats protein-like [Fundulus heteroclitus]
MKEETQREKAHPLGRSGQLAAPWEHSGDEGLAQELRVSDLVSKWETFRPSRMKSSHSLPTLQPAPQQDENELRQRVGEMKDTFQTWKKEPENLKEEPQRKKAHPLGRSGQLAAPRERSGDEGLAQEPRVSDLVSQWETFRPSRMQSYHSLLTRPPPPLEHENEFQTWKKELENLKEELQREKDENARLTKKIKDQEEDKKKLVCSLREHQDKRNEWENDIDGLKQDLEKEKDENAKLTKKIKDQEEENKELFSMLEEQYDKLNKWEMELDGLKKDLEKEKAGNSRLQDDIKKLKDAKESKK